MESIPMDPEGDRLLAAPPRGCDVRNGRTKVDVGRHGRETRAGWRSYRSRGKKSGLLVRLGPGELLALYEEALDEGVTMSEYVRQAIEERCRRKHPDQPGWWRRYEDDPND